MREFAGWNYERGWTMQLHLGAIRNNNARIFETYGYDGGCDSIGDFSHARPLNDYLNMMDERGHLPRVILFNSNPGLNPLDIHARRSVILVHMYHSTHIGEKQWLKTKNRKRR